MIDPVSRTTNPLAPVLPAAPAPPTTTPAPRYLTVQHPDRRLKTVVRRDGLPLGYVPPPKPTTPAPPPETLGLRLFDADGLRTLWERRVAHVRRPRQPAAPADPDAPVFTPDQLQAARTELGISRCDLAAALGISRGMMGECERGRRRLNAGCARRLAGLLADHRARRGVR